MKDVTRMVEVRKWHPCKGGSLVEEQMPKLKQGKASPFKLLIRKLSLLTPLLLAQWTRFEPRPPKILQHNKLVLFSISECLFFFFTILLLNFLLPMSVS